MTSGDFRFRKRVFASAHVSDTLRQHIPRSPSSPGFFVCGGNMRHVRVGLAGCGVVGGELTRLLAAYRTQIEEQHHVCLKIVSVLVRDAAKIRAVPLERDLFTNDVSRFLAHEADVVVEAIGGLSPAERIARATLERGARFVTANKALLAESPPELLANIDFEAAVGGGIPIVRALRNSLRNTPVRRISAILNGTTNYILTRMERGASFEAALADAQRSGFAEADPSRDLNGIDTADKLRVLAWLAFGVPPRTLDVFCQGVLPDPYQLVRAAAAEDSRVRLIGTCERADNGEIRASVRPKLVARDSAFGRTLDEQNVIVVDFGWNQPITLSGPGAGGLPTASALLGDLLCC